MPGRESRNPAHVLSCISVRNLKPKLNPFVKPKLKPKLFLLNWVPAERALRDVPYVLGVYCDAPLSHVKEPEEQLDYGALASAGRADESRRLAGIHSEGNILQDRSLAVVGKVDVPGGQFNSFVEISTDFSTDFSTEFL